MNNRTGKVKIFISLVIVSFSLLMSVPAQTEHEGDWFSANTLASVVKLSSVIRTYEVEGLADNYQYHTKGNDPDFGKATVVSEREKFVAVGSGVVISKDGLIISNAHVTRAYLKPEISSSGRVGPNGKPVKIVTINPYPSIMFVGVTDKNKIENGNDAQSLKYVAYILEDDHDYDNYKRDRAVLKILYTAHMGSDGFPVLDEKIKDVDVPYVKFGNPFRTSFSDRKVRAIGFPGTGDPNRSARTVGELLGYESDAASKILHTCYIAGGNSGGGLFYKDNLIGINTWDNLKDKSRPLGLSQPVTYWFDILLKTVWRYPKLEIPEGLDLDWLADDPSVEAYKNETQVLLTLVSESDKNTPVTKGKIYTHRIDTDISDVLTYLNIAGELDDAAAIVYYLQYFSVDELVERTGFTKNYIELFSTVSDTKQIRNMMKPQMQPYFDEWYNNTFYCKEFRLDDSDGRTVISVPKGSKLNFTFVPAGDGKPTTFTLTAGEDYMQGPYTVSVSQ